MPDKLPTVRPKQVSAALVKAGFVMFRQKGSHAHYRRGTLSSILRQAHMTAEEFAPDPVDAVGMALSLAPPAIDARGLGR